MVAIFAVLGVALGPTAGCGGARSGASLTHPVPVIGPHSGGAAVFDRVHAALHDAGYAPDVVDAHAGRMSAPARSHDRRGPIRVVVQLYREGWIRISAEGRAVTESGATLSSSDEVWNEIAELAIAVDRRLSEASGAGATP